jgi:peptide/nickel transport system substrate-binding protein
MGKFGERRVILAAAAGLALVAGLAGEANASSLSHLDNAARPQATGGVIKYAELPSSSANYIFPETTTANQSLYNNSQFINLMYPTIYPPAPYEPVVDFTHGAMAYPPVWSDNNTVATVKLKPFKWSDGTPVTARDYIFYINLGMALGTSWGNYGGPTQFPYNLKSYTAVNPMELKFVLKAPINPTFFLDNGIDYLVAMPQHAWDKTSATGAVGNYDMTPAGAKQVVAFLGKEAADTNTYTSNPLWKVVDGPWMLQSFGGQSSPDIFVPNPGYSGPKPYASQFEEIPFTTDSAEFTSIKAGSSSLDYGYVPTQDIPAIPSVQGEGYSISKVPEWGFDYTIPNLKNPQVGPILSQLYIRQVLTELTDQATMIKHFMFGYGIPTYGPTPIYPLGNPFVTAAEKTDPYPFSIATAEKTLKAHGWQVNPGKVDVCTTAGAAGCGAGIKAGTKLSFNLLYANGTAITQEDNDLFQSDAAQAGVQISLRSATFNTVISTVQACTPKEIGTATCNWQLGEYGGISESTYPSGEGLLNTGGAFNAGSFSDPQIDNLINQSSVAPTLAAYHNYENLVVKEVPWIWQPVPDNIAATSSGLTGYGLTSEFGGFYGYIEPQFWYFTK